MSTKRHPKKNGYVGRPRTNAKPVLVRIPPDILKRLDGYCRRLQQGRPAAIRMILAKSRTLRA